MIRLRDAYKSYRMGDVTVRALDGVSLDIEDGEFVAIMGPSGSGKSTLMHILGLLDPPDSGSYVLRGQEVANLSEDEAAKFRSETIGFVFQQFNLLPRTRAIENVLLPTVYSDIPASADKGAELLKRVGLGERQHHKPNELSGGQQQRVAIARALINSPILLFADEPTGNLDSESTAEIMKVFQELNRSGITIVLVTHEPEISEYAKRVIRMKDGRIQSDIKKDESRSALRVPEVVHERKGRAALALAAFHTYVRQGLNSLSSNKVRTTLSMLGILIGVAAVIAMLALGNGAKRSMEEQLSSLGSNLLVLSPGSRRSFGISGESGTVTRFTLEDAKDIEKSVVGVKRTSVSVSGRARAIYGNKNWATFITGTLPVYAEVRNYPVSVGRYFTLEEDRTRARVAIIGLTLVRELFGEANPIGETIKLNKINFQVIGVLKEKGNNGFRDNDDVVIIPISTAMRRLLGKDFVDSIDIEVESPDGMESVQDAITEMVITRHNLPPSQQDSFNIRNMAEIQDALSATSRIMSLLLATIAAISLLVGGIGIMNIMLVTVTERTREIGLRKAIGAKQRDIMAQFLIESIIVSVSGGTLGVLLGSLVTYVIAKFVGWSAFVSPGSVVLSFVFSAGIGVVFGLWPARKASKLHPISALRFE